MGPFPWGLPAAWGKEKRESTQRRLRTPEIQANGRMRPRDRHAGSRFPESEPGVFAPSRRESVEERDAKGDLDIGGIRCHAGLDVEHVEKVAAVGVPVEPVPEMGETKASSVR